jgi:hypothetical protein
MSEKVFDGKENLSPKGKENIQKETRERVGQVTKELVEKFTGFGFRKEDFGPAIKKGLDDAKNDVK